MTDEDLYTALLTILGAPPAWQTDPTYPDAPDVDTTVSDSDGEWMQRRVDDWLEGVR